MRTNPFAPHLTGELSKDARLHVAALLSGEERNAYATPHEAAIRRDESDRDRDTMLRPAYVRDSEKILHMPAYNRLAGKTQVFSFRANDDLTRRGLHVQLVARVARDIGYALGLNLDLIEAIALGHDIGHTPCGHTGEAELARLLAKHGAGTFMHNAQSVRVLQHLEKGGRGLNLTLPVLDGILGHNGEIEVPVYDYNRKNLTWEKLEANLAECMKTPGFDRQVFPSTLEGCVVRVSDIISYIGKDIEDAIAVGIIKRTDIPERCVRVLGKRNTDIIGTLCTDIVEHSFGKGHLEFSPEVFEAYRELKAFNGARIYGCNLLAEQRGKFTRMMAMLFEVYLEAVERDDLESGVCKDYLRHFPHSYRDETPPARIVADYLSLMTDQYFLKQFEREFMTREIDYD